MKEGVSQGSLFCGPGGLWGFDCLFVCTRGGGGGLQGGIGACLFACCERGAEGCSGGRLGCMQAWERGNLVLAVSGGKLVASGGKLVLVVSGGKLDVSGGKLVLVARGGKLTSGRTAFNFDGTAGFTIAPLPFGARGAVGLLPAGAVLLVRGTIGPLLLVRGAVAGPLLLVRGAIGPVLLVRGAVAIGPLLLETATPLSFIRDCFAFSWASLCSAEIGAEVIVCSTCSFAAPLDCFCWTEFASELKVCLSPVCTSL